MTPPVVTPPVVTPPVVTPPVVVPLVPDQVVGLAAPFRALDTRSTAAVVPTGSITTVNVVTAGVPADAKAVSLNVTATGTTGAGYVTVYPCDAARPETSNLNFVGGQTIANTVLAKPSATGTICLFNSIGTELLVDVGGYLPAGFAYDAITPVRLLDTRSGAVVPANTVTQVPVAGTNGVAGNAKAAALNVTAVNAGAEGYLTVFPCGAGAADSVVVELRCRPDDPGSGACHDRAEREGVHLQQCTGAPVGRPSGSFAAGAAYTALTPTRVLDTRQGTPVPVAAGTSVRGLARRGDPRSGGGSVDGDVGGITGGRVPHRLSLRDAAQRIEPQLRGWAADRQHRGSRRSARTNSVCVFSSATTHLIIDVSGAF